MDTASKLFTFAITVNLMCGGFPTGVLAAVSTSIYQMMEMLEKPIHHMVVRSSHSSTSAISYEQHPTHWFGDTHGVASRSLAPAPPVTNSAAAATHCDGAVGTNRLLLRSQHDPLCSDSILVIYHDPGGAPPTPPGAARGGSGRVPDTRFKLCPLQLLLQSGAPGLLPELRMCSSVTTAGGLHTGACRFVPLSHESHGRARPLPLRSSMRLQSVRPRLERSPRKSSYRMQRAALPQCRGAARQVFATALFQGCLDGRPGLPGRALTDVLALAHLHLPAHLAAQRGRRWRLDVLLQPCPPPASTQILRPHLGQIRRRARAPASPSNPSLYNPAPPPRRPGRSFHSFRKRHSRSCVRR